MQSVNAFLQVSHKSKLRGWWINTHYNYFQNKPQYNKLLYEISPWFIKIDPCGRCTVILLYQQSADWAIPKKRILSLELGTINIKRGTKYGYIA